MRALLLLSLVACAPRPVVVVVRCPAHEALGLTLGPAEPASPTTRGITSITGPVAPADGDGDITITSISHVLNDEARQAAWNESWLKIEPDAVTIYEDETRCFSHPIGVVLTVNCTSNDLFTRTTCGMQSRPCSAHIALLGAFAGRLGFRGDVWLK